MLVVPCDGIYHLLTDVENSREVLQNRRDATITLADVWDSRIQIPHPRLLLLKIVLLFRRSIW